jgi:ABC-type Zn uptake system ZnuABC Zn-binding protein ZnuA
MNAKEIAEQFVPLFPKNPANVARVQANVEEAINALVNEAREEERAECRDIALEEFKYWKRDEEGRETISIGALAASANIVAKIFLRK